jgi:glyceraldehyde 3-phosphate dehydrogenase
MAVRVAINGFGRIGRLVLRALYESKRTDIKVVAINDLASFDMSAHLLRHDSVHGLFPHTVLCEKDKLMIDGEAIQMVSEKSPENLPWKEMNIDVVMECSGIFTDREKASLHLKAGAKKVLISAPATNADKTIVYGVNHKTLTAQDIIVSNASCTTNCLAPVAAVLHRSVGIKHGYMTTIHAYTGDQRIVDTSHSDPRRARAGALSMIPTSTGAARAVGLVLPELAGKLDGTAIRVPIPNVSMVDLTFTSLKSTTVAEINEIMEEAAKTHFKEILHVNHEPLVSIDFNHSAYSSIFDATQTQIVEGTFCRVVSWYDNEWGFSNRMSDTAAYMAKL